MPNLKMLNSTKYLYNFTFVKGQERGVSENVEFDRIPLHHFPSQTNPSICPDIRVFWTRRHLTC